MRAQEKGEAAQSSRLSPVQPPPGWASPGQEPVSSVTILGAGGAPGARRSPWSQQARWACSGQLQPSASTSQPRGAQLEVSPEAGDGGGERSGLRAARIRPQPAGTCQEELACRMVQQLRNHLPTPGPSKHVDAQLDRGTLCCFMLA